MRFKSWLASSFLLLCGCGILKENVVVNNTKQERIYTYSLIQEGPARILDGEFNEFYDANGPLRTRFAIYRGRAQGEYKSYYQDGSARCSAHFREGLFHGNYEEYYPPSTQGQGGIRAEGSYLYGKRQGEWSESYPDGAKALISMYQDGILHGIEQEFYPKGQIKTRTHYEKGQIVFVKAYDEVGVLLVYKDLVDGRLFDYCLNNFATKYKSGQHKSSYSVIGCGPKKDQRFGFERHFHESGILAEEKVWKDGQLTSRQQFTPLGKLILSHVLEDQHLKIKTFYGPDQLKSEESWLGNQKDGIFRLFDPGSILRKLEMYKLDNLEGAAEEYDERGKLRLKVHYQAGQKEGKALIYDALGALTEERNYKAGRLHGIQTIYAQEGQVEQVSAFKEGIKEGIWISYFDGGNKKAEVSYKNGLLHGAYVEFFKEGQKKREAIYSRDKIDGQEILYREDGTKISQISWQEGEIHGLETLFNSKGEVLTTSVYVKGKKHGPARTFFESGKVKEDLSYREGQIFGQRTQYYENGRPRSICKATREGVFEDCQKFLESGEEVFEKE